MAVVYAVKIARRLEQGMGDRSRAGVAREATSSGSRCTPRSRAAADAITIAQLEQVLQTRLWPDQSAPNLRRWFLPRWRRCPTCSQPARLRSRVTSAGCAEPIARARTAPRCPRSALSRSTCAVPGRAPNRVLDASQVEIISAQAATTATPRETDVSLVGEGAVRAGRHSGGCFRGFRGSTARLRPP